MTREFKESQENPQEPELIRRTPQVDYHSPSDDGKTWVTIYENANVTVAEPRIDYLVDPGAALSMMVTSRVVGYSRNIRVSDKNGFPNYEFMYRHGPLQRNALQQVTVWDHEVVDDPYEQIVGQTETRITVKGPYYSEDVKFRRLTSHTEEEGPTLNRRGLLQKPMIDLIDNIVDQIGRVPNLEEVRTLRKKKK